MRTITLFFAAAACLAFGQYDADTLRGRPPCSATRTQRCVPVADQNGNFPLPAAVSASTSISAPRHLLQCTAGTGGVTASTLVKFSGATCVALAASTDGILGIARFSTSAGNSVDVVIAGASTCVAEGSITAGNWVVAGTSNPARCKDSGQSSMRAVALSVPVVGIAATAGTDGNNTNINVLAGYRTGAKSDSIIATSCGGTVGTANATTYAMGLYGSNGNCNSATIVEAPIPVASTASRFYCRAGSAGAQAGSGVMTLYKNGSPTAITCTLGTGTTCSDLVNSVAFAAGDTHAIRVLTGQASDTTANIRCSFALTEN